MPTESTILTNYEEIRKLVALSMEEARETYVGTDGKN